MKTLLISILLVGVIAASGCLEAVCETNEDCIPAEPKVGVKYICQEGVCTEKALGNPASDYCEENDGRLVVGIDLETGGQPTFCFFEDTESYCRQWDYYRGDCDKEERFYKCSRVGTFSEGYYDKDTDELIAWETCGSSRLPNPASVYCEEQGGKIELRDDPRPEGGQYGVCILANGTVCEEWAYYRGGCESCLTYCEKQPHIMCVGNWNISGEYPDCSCEFICS